MNSGSWYWDAIEFMVEVPGFYAFRVVGLEEGESEVPSIDFFSKRLKKYRR